MTWILYMLPCLPISTHQTNVTKKLDDVIITKYYIMYTMYRKISKMHLFSQLLLHNIKKLKDLYGFSREDDSILVSLSFSLYLSLSISLSTHHISIVTTYKL